MEREGQRGFVQILTSCFYVPLPAGFRLKIVNVTTNKCNEIMLSLW